MKLKKMIAVATCLALTMLFADSLVVHKSAVAAGGESVQAPGEVSISTSRDKINVASLVEFNIRASHVANADLYGIELEVKYDPLFLQLNNNAVGSFASSGYTTFAGEKVMEGTIFLPLIRENSSNKLTAEQVDLAKLRFKAIKTGKTTIEITKMKAVTSETFINNDLVANVRELPLSIADPLEIVIQANYTPSEMESGSAVISLIAKLDQEKDPVQANQLAQALIAGIQSSTPERVRDDAQRVLQQYIHSVMQFSSGAEVKQLTDALQQVDQLIKKATEKNIQLDQEAAIVNHAAGAIVLSSEALGKLESSSPIQIESNLPRPLEQAGAKLRAIAALTTILPIKGGSETVSGATVRVAYNATNGDSELLGLYRYNDATGMWEYIRDAQRTAQYFTAPLTGSGQFAVMEYRKQFEDLDGVYIGAKRAIEVLAARHIISGMDEKRYAPGKHVTRAEMAKLFVDLLQLPLAEEKGQSSFTDVQGGAWYGKYIAAAKQAGFINGFTDGSFKPQAELSREQVAVMMIAIYESQHGEIVLDETSLFADDTTISSWAKKAVYKAQAIGLLKGKGNNKFAPKEAMNRQDAAVVLYNLLNKN